MVFTVETRILQSLFLASPKRARERLCPHATPPPPKPAVTVVELRARPVSLTTELPGRVSTYRIAEVRPQVNGVILKRMFKEGDLVTAGRTRVRVDR